jgi:hypothetical protein
MAIITLNNIAGDPPYDIIVCDIYQNLCVSALTYYDYIPPSFSFEAPSQFNYAPQLLIKIIDRHGCQYNETYMCVTPTPTPSITPTNTPTISITPTNTPTISITPTNTPTISITPTITPTPSITPSITPTNTQTPTQTNTPTPSRNGDVPNIYLFIEPFSGSTSIGQWMSDRGCTEFFGFTNGTSPSLSDSTFQTEMVHYFNFTGWTSGEFPSLVTTTIPTFGGGVDSFGNPIVAYNFITTQIPENTIGTQAWYTWIIPINLTNYQIQSQIDVSIDNPNVLTSTYMESTIYNKVLLFTGNTIGYGYYRVYTTFPSSNFQLNNTSNIYFRGSTLI